MPANFANGTDTDRADWAKAIAYISQTPEGAFLAGQLWSHNVTVVFTYDGNDSYDNVNNILYWDSKSTLNVIQPNGQVGAQSAALGLLHELYHWYTKKITGDFDEYLATAYETRAADLLGEPARAHYNAVYSANPSAHADNTTASAKGGYWKKVEDGQIVQGPEYDPNVEVITTEPPEPTGGGGDGGGGYTPPYSGGGGSTGGGGGGTGVVIVQPVPDPEENPEIVYNPYDQDYAPDPLGIVGVPDPIL